jgi:putative sigma-54 modulation protein
MQLSVRSRNGAVQDAFRDYAQKKVSKLERYFTRVDSARLEQAVERGMHIVELNVEGDGVFLRSEERCNDMYAAVDNAVEKLERQVVRFKGRKRHGRQRPGPVKESAAALAEDAVSTEPDEESGEDHEIRITRRKRFPMQPMQAEEAALQMELTDHDFFLFQNENTGNVNLLYRRRKGDYGLIELDA